MGDQDGPDRTIEPHLGYVSTEEHLRHGVDGAAGPHERQERRPHDDRGQHERHHREGPQRATPGKVEASEGPRRRQAQQQCQGGREAGEGQREQHDVDHERLERGADHAPELELACGCYTQRQDVGDRPQEEQPQERQGRDRQDQSPA